jgi:hypothetical protein
MAVFNKDSLTQVSGFDNPIIAGELVYNQRTFWNLAINDSDGTPVDLTGAIIDAQIIRRKLSNVRDSRYGLTFDIADYTPTPSPVPLTIMNRINESGLFTLVIDSNAWGLIAADPDLDIANINGAGFSGRIKITFPGNLSNPVEDNIIFLLFLVRSDAINN